MCSSTPSERLGKCRSWYTRGPILGRARSSAVLWGEGVSNLKELVDAADQQNASWKVESGARDLRRLSESRETNGFFVVFGMTGLVSETVYVFRRGGWGVRDRFKRRPTLQPLRGRVGGLRKRADYHAFAVGTGLCFCDKPRDREGSLTRPIRRPAQHRPCSPGRRAT